MKTTHKLVVELYVPGATEDKLDAIYADAIEALDALSHRSYKAESGRWLLAHGSGDIKGV